MAVAELPKAEPLPNKEDAKSGADLELLEALGEAVPRALDIERSRRIFVNRNLRMDEIEMVGFDMDYTLALYNQRNLEELSIRCTLDKLVAKRGYPAGDPRARATTATSRCAGWSSIASTATSSRRTATATWAASTTASSCSTRRCATRSTAPQRMRLSHAALRLDRHPVRAARGGAVRVPRRLLRVDADQKPRLRAAVAATSASASTRRTATRR